MRNLHEPTDIIRQVQNAIYENHSKGSKINIFWIPGHCGIEGNKLVDFEAKKASTLPLIAHTPVIAKNDVQLLIKSKCLHSWLSLWNLQTTKLHEVKQNVSPWPHLLVMPRKIEVAKASH
jgi:hypothetical protein